MRFLALDTSTDVCALATGVISESGGFTVVAALDLDARRAAMSTLLPAMRSVLASSGWTVHDVEAFVVGRGPGSFTGVRIGVATAKGLAHCHRQPLWGVSTLDAIAARFGRVEGLLGVIGDAMRGEVYPALYSVEKGRARRLTDDMVASPADAARHIRDLAAGRPVLLTGNGLAKYSEGMLEVIGPDTELAPERLWSPSGRGLVRAFGNAWRDGSEGDGDLAALLPIYTRLSDAEENERARAGTPAIPGTGVAGPDTRDGAS